MEKENKTKSFYLYLLVAVALLMAISTVTMAVLTDRKKGNNVITMGKVGISGMNSNLELVIDDTITDGAEILNENRKFYFAPTDDTQPMFVRFKIEYQIDAEIENKTEVLEILNSTLRSENFNTYSDENKNYSYYYKNTYYYLVEYGSNNILIDSLRQVTASESIESFIISDDYKFELASKDDGILVYGSLVGTKVKLVVTLEAIQVEGIANIEEAWPIYVVNYTSPSGELLEQNLYKNSNGATVLSKNTFNENVLYAWGDEHGNTYNSGDEINFDNGTEVNLTAIWAGLYDNEPEPAGIMENEVSISEDEPVTYGTPAYTWQQLIQNNYISVSGTTVSQGASINRTSALDGKLYLPENITSIASGASSTDGAFESCNNLTEVYGKFITAIGNYTFYNNTGIEKVITPEVTSIGTYICYGCTSLEEFETGDCTSIPNYAFQNCSSLTEMISSDAVSSIGTYAYSGCTSLTKITIPTSVTSIGTYAFNNCSQVETINFNATSCNNFSSGNNIFTTSSANVQSVTLNVGSNCTRIPSYAFSDFSKLKNIVYASDCRLVTVGNYAFQNCTGLTTLIIPESITTLSNYAFSGCRNVETLNFNAINCGNFTSNANVFRYLGSNTATDCNIGDKVTNIPNYFMYDTSNYPKIRSINYADSDVGIRIGTYAFRAHPQLTQLNLSNRLRTIESRAFYSMNAINTIYVHCSQVTSVGNLAFNIMTRPNIIICSDVTRIPDNLFRSETGGTSTGNGWYRDGLIINTVIFEEGCQCTSIGAKAFSYVVANRIEIPEFITEIKSQAFYELATPELHFNAINCNTTATDAFSCLNNCTYYDSYNNNTLYIGNKVERIPNNLFRNANAKRIVFDDNSVCQSIGQYGLYTNKTESVNIPASLQYIDNYGFYSQKGIVRNVYYHDLDEWLNFDFRNRESNPIGLSGNLYINDVLVTDIEVPASFTTIKYSICGLLLDSLTVNTGNTVYTSKDSNGNELYTIMNMARTKVILGCKRSEILSGVTEICENAFLSTKIESITIPSTVTKIGASAFENCSELRNINYNATNCTNFDKTAFKNASLDCGAVVTIGANVTSLPSYMFFPNSGYYTTTDLPNVEQLIFADNSQCTSIGGYAFAQASMLINVKLSQNITSIGNYAFYNCTSLNSIELPGTLMAINSSAFQGCTKLYEVINSSNLSLTKGNTSYGYVAYYAKKVIVPPNESDVYVYYDNNNTLLENSNGASFRVSIEDGVYKLVKYIGTDTTVNIPTAVTYISSRAITSGVATRVVIPTTITTMEAEAFYMMNNLNYIDYRATNCGDCTSSNVFFKSGFSGDGITVTIATNVTKIPSYAFYGATNASNIKIININSANGLVIGTYAFANLYNVEELNYNAVNCTDLVKDNYAFRDLAKDNGGAVLNIGTAVTRLPGRLFCSIRESYDYSMYPRFRTIYFNATNCNDSVSNAKIFEYCGYNQDGRANLIIGKDVVRVPGYIFSSQHGFHVLTLTFEEGSSCTQIGNYAFNNLFYDIGPAELRLPSGLLRIGNRAFFNCDKIGAIYIPSSVNYLDVGSFGNSYHPAYYFEDITGWRTSSGQNITSLYLSGKTPQQIGQYIGYASSFGNYYNGSYAWMK